MREHHHPNPDHLPPPEDLTPLSQTLISPDLALAFGITITPEHPIVTRHVPPNPSDFDSSSGGDDSARTLKRPRLVWTPQLHKRFVDAVAQLGIKNAVPKTIMQLMSVDGLTRENVASHLQKYRLYLKRMQNLGSGGGIVSGSGDPATDHLFASSPVPAHFLLPQQYGQFGGFGNSFLSRQGQVVLGNPDGGVESAAAAVGGRRVLTLFPSGD